MSAAVDPRTGAVQAVRISPSLAWQLPLDRRTLIHALQAMLQAARNDPRAPAHPCGVDLHILDDAGISAANRRFLGCVGPTNILSFPGDGNMPGALLLSLDTLRRECLLYGQKPEEHTLRLLAHGMGHLCGLDHGPVMDGLCSALAAAAAEALEEERSCLRRRRGHAP